LPRINRAYQSGLFQAPIKSTNKEYRDLCERLEIVDRILTKGGLEFEFASIVPEEVIRKLNALLAKTFAAEGNVFQEFELEEPLDVKDILIDSTCLMARIHFPVDWVLLRDAVRTLVKAILCIRRHGLKHRIPAD